MNKGGRPRGMAWQTFLENCTPRLWQLRVKSIELDDPDAPVVHTAFALPDDRDVPNMLALRGCGAGLYEVSPKCTARGESFEMERRRLKLLPNHKLPSAKVHLSADQAQAPREPRRATDGVASSRAAAEIAENAARAAAAKAEAAEAAARARKAEREIGDPPASAKGDPWATMLPILLQQQQAAAEAQAKTFALLLEQQQTREAALLQLLAQRTPAAAAPGGGGGGIGGILGQVRQLMELREFFRDDAAPAAGGDEPEGVAWLRELRETAKQLGIFPRAGAAAAAPAGSPPMLVPAPPAAAGAPPPALASLHNLAAGRVQQFAVGICQEIAALADPEAAAERFDQQIDGLPSNVKAALERGDWRETWVTMRPHLHPDLATQLDKLLAEADVATWCAKFAGACQLEDEAAGDPARAAQ